jgi:pseudouridylate synthase
MKNTNYLELNPLVLSALNEGKPVVALESTIISHGMPYPQNVETALMVEAKVRENGATPATIAIINGKMKAGLTVDEIEILGKQGQDVTKVSRRDIHRLRRV